MLKDINLIPHKHGIHNEIAVATILARKNMNCYKTH